MFSIVTSRAMEENIQLERCVSQMHEEYLEAESVARELGSLSGMKELQERLKNQVEIMQAEGYGLRQMMQALEKATACYDRNENKICENAEQSAISYAVREVGTNDFSKLSGLLGEVMTG